MRSFEIARKVVDDKLIKYETDRCQTDTYEPAYPNAKIPEYQTTNSAGADFFCAEDVTIPSIWGIILNSVGSKAEDTVNRALYAIAPSLCGKRDDVAANAKQEIEPTLVHTGIKACMEDDEVLELYNRSSNPSKLGLVLANGVGVVDADYYNNVKNDGEIMFAFYNFKPWSVTIKAGDKIGQGVFKKYLRPTEGLRIKNVERKGGFGSTN